LDEKITRMQSDINGLSLTIEERDTYIKKLSGEISALQNTVQELEGQLAEESARETPVTPQAAGVYQASFSFVESRGEIEGLIAGLESGLSQAGINNVVIAELEDLRLRRDIALNTLNETTAELAQMTGRATAVQFENDELKARLRTEMVAANQAARDLEIIRQRVDISFTASQLAGYMSQAIDNFNREANAGDHSVNYIINDMEVIFKASLTKNETGEMTLAAPSLSSGDAALSTIKFGINAIPKDKKDND